MALEEFVQKSLLAIANSVNNLRSQGVEIPAMLTLGPTGEYAKIGAFHDADGNLIHMVRFRVVVGIKQQAGAGVSLVVPTVQVGMGADVSTVRSSLNTVDFSIPLSFPKRRKEP